MRTAASMGSGTGVKQGAKQVGQSLKGSANKIPGVPKVVSGAKTARTAASMTSGTGVGQGVKQMGSGVKQMGGASLRATGAKISGMSTGAKLGIGTATGAAVGGAAGFGGGRKSAFGKAYAGSSMGALKNLSRASHANALHASFAAKKMPGAAQRAAKVRNAATVRSGGKNTVRSMLQAKSPTTASGSLRKNLSGHDVFGVEV